MTLTSFRTLGRSGLVVSPLALGAMTFGTPRWGSPDDVSQAVFNAYVDAGGNFIDTADVYAKGRSEELVGQYIAERSLRDKLVLATKFAFNAEPGNPHAGGNGAKNIHRALEGSLRRLKTDYVDLYWLHVWDMVTPAEEVLHTLGNLVRSGKIRYFGLSDIPAWYAAKMATLAAATSVPAPVGLQLEYSLIAREIEREHIHAALDCGMGLTPWSPLGAGFLTGKYTREENGAVKEGTGRLHFNLPSFQKFNDRNWRVLEQLRPIAEQVGKPLAQVALAWVLAQPAVAAPIIGVTKVEQLQDNLASLELTLTPEQLSQLGQASEPGSIFFSPGLRKMIFGGSQVQGWR